MGAFSGFDKSQDTTELPDGLAVAAVNCFHANRKSGMLGARLGRVWVATAAEASDVYGVGKLVLPNDSGQWVTAEGTNASQGNAPYESPTEEVEDSNDTTQIITFPDTNASTSWPTTSEDVTVSLITPIPAGTYEIFVPQTYVISVSAATGTEIFNAEIEIRLLDADNNIVKFNVIEQYNNVKTSFDTPADPEQFRKMSATIGATATQITFRFVTNGGAGVSDVAGTAGPLNYILVRS